MLSFKIRTFLAVVLALLSAEAAAVTDLLTRSSSRFQAFCNFCTEQQKNIISQIETVETQNIPDLSDACRTTTHSSFTLDPWERFTENSGRVGHGLTAVLQGGRLVEKGAVSTTFLSGKLTPERARAISSRQNLDYSALIDQLYYACALSLVLHSRSPMAPTFRADIRYFELSDGTCWFGGGADLTPYYLFDDDARKFHESYSAVCSNYSPALYSSLKKWCDEYFFIPSRGEHRGIGGIFFDDLTDIDQAGRNLKTSVEARDIDRAMGFTKDVCTNFMPSYLPILEERSKLPFTEKEKHWQLLRRGRYVEFNLLFDRGVKFGLVPGGRTEAVLVSCPPVVAWDYNHIPEEGSEEARLMSVLKSPLNWISK